MSTIPDLEAYRFYEREWTEYDDLLDSFEWEVPERFNMASYICDRWCEDGDRTALVADDGDGNGETYSFERLRKEADATAAFLRERGVSRGDRVGINARQRPETVVAHVACWKLGAVSVPLSTLFGTDALSYRLDDSGSVACFVDDSNVETLREIRDDVPSLETVVTIGDVEPTDDETAFGTVLSSSSERFETVD
ncbi:MAG: AMP-binding protein, partial [Natronomonas sp.]|nr:AMP-binding protein [Natronomonas sp.]